MARNRSPNRLFKEKSPYLRQHAHNPVDWYPWGEEVFAKAAEEDKPIFLSVGYSTCHWCHVMEKESFEDDEVAGILNDSFLSVKVDREERPDIDSIYMHVCQLMTGRGGWPLTIIMTPEKKPFFAATYIAKNSRFGQAGLLVLLSRVDHLWKNNRSDMVQSAETIIKSLTSIPAREYSSGLNLETLHTAFSLLKNNFDEKNGGFTPPPKFPTPQHLLFLLRYQHRTEAPQALSMVDKTLSAMRRGGIFDHIGSGFHRYSTDSRWFLPHFEKMIYDQALLLMTYSEAYQVTRNEKLKMTAQEIFNYVSRDMTSPEGGFYTAEDADSEGEEGKFYTWTWAEIHEHLNNEEAELAVRIYGLEKGGNFNEEGSGQKSGRNILHITKPLEALASELKTEENSLEISLKRIREKLFSVRQQRIRPLRDDKVLTDWNGLMIAALAKAAQAAVAPGCAEAASEAAYFILNSMADEQLGLMHRYREGETSIPAFADDYAFLIFGLVELYQTTFEEHWLESSLRLQEIFNTHFWDSKSGGFYFTHQKAENLFIRKKEAYDGAIPSSNSVALLNLLRLSRLTGKPEFETMATKLIEAMAIDVERYPAAYTFFLSSLDFALGPTFEAVVCGGRRALDTRKMLDWIKTEYLPNRVTLFLPDGEKDSTIRKIAPFTAHHTSQEGKAAVYICRNHACLRPTTDPSEMIALLKEKEFPKP
jgi:uncharacterized protein YyaL (SSP411 family)